MLRAHKQLVRTRIAARLRSVPPPEVQRQSADWECETISSQMHRRAKNVAVFVSMPNSEIDTREILEELLRPGSSRKCFLPKVSNEQNIMNMLQVHSIAELDAFPVHHKFKIPEPPNDGKRENAFDSGLDLVLVPGMAFGKRCTRLGHGKGYYDRFIATMRHQAEKRNPDEPRYPTLVGLALNEQMYDFVPVEKNDEILNQIIWAEPEKPLGEYDELTRDLHT